MIDGATVINEAPNIGGMFWGVGVMVFFFVMAYLFYLIAKNLNVEYEYEVRFNTLKCVLLNKFAKKKDIDLEKEYLKREVYAHNRKNLRKRLEEEIYNDLFPKEKGKED